ncbi:MAG: hypothetical protein ACYDD0_06365 [Candidatus Dormibacteria bacterium]
MILAWATPAEGRARHRIPPRVAPPGRGGLIATIGGVVAVFQAMTIVLEVTAGSGGQDTQVLAARAFVVAAITRSRQPLWTRSGPSTSTIPRADQDLHPKTHPGRRAGGCHTSGRSAALLRRSLVGRRCFGKSSNLQTIWEAP